MPASAQLALLGDSPPLIAPPREEPAAPPRDLGAQVRLARQMGRRLAHTMNNRLTVLKALLQVAEFSPADAEGRRVIDAEDLRTLDEQLDELHRVVLEFGQLSTMLDQQPQPLDARAAVERALASVTPQARERGVTLRAAGMAPLPVLADPAALERAMAQLLCNAVEASRSGQEVLVETHVDDRMATIEVRDHGCGMDPATCAAALDPFFTTKSGHVGLGLTACWSELARMGGTMDLRSARGDGTHARVTLPLAEASG